MSQDQATRTVHYRACTFCEAICGLEIEVEAAGASVNDLTDDARVDPVVFTSALNGTPVEVEAARVARTGAEDLE